MVPRAVSSTVILRTPTPKGGPGGRVVMVVEGSVVVPGVAMDKPIA